MTRRLRKEKAPVHFLATCTAGRHSLLLAKEVTADKASGSIVRHVSPNCRQPCILSPATYRIVPSALIATSRALSPTPVSSSSWCIVFCICSMIWNGINPLSFSPGTSIRKDHLRPLIVQHRSIPPRQANIQVPGQASHRLPGSHIRKHRHWVTPRGRIQVPSGAKMGKLSNSLVQLFKFNKNLLYNL